MLGKKEFIEKQIKDILGICIEPDLLEVKVNRVMVLLEMAYTDGYLNGMRAIRRKKKGGKELTFDVWINNQK